MAGIRVLDPHVSALIAAGEVGERPGAVVKELLENAFDAGATVVTVEIQGGGLTYIRVTDNGCGIAPEDAKTAFLRHATSKIVSERDLEAIGTLGFRGEALAAIAAVSRVDLLTRVRGAEAGVSLSLEGGVPGELLPAGCPEGTTIIVRDLFFNTPARMKFMKRDTPRGLYRKPGPAACPLASGSVGQADSKRGGADAHAGRRPASFQYLQRLGKGNCFGAHSGGRVRGRPARGGLRVKAGLLQGHAGKPVLLCQRTFGEVPDYGGAVGKLSEPEDGSKFRLVLQSALNNTVDVNCIRRKRRLNS
jgi:hypothetical protein